MSRLHTVAVVLEKQRPVAGIDGRRRGLWLDGVSVGVGLHESHCVEFGKTWCCTCRPAKLSKLLGRRENFMGGPCISSVVGETGGPADRGVDEKVRFTE